MRREESQEHKPAPEYTRPSTSDNVPKLDGYRLGYRAAPQRPSYQNRDNGYRNSSYSGGNASYNNGYNNSYNNGYRQNNFRQQSAPAYGGYGQQQPMYPSRTPVDNRLSDSIYRMSRDQQFTEQAEAGMIPDLLKVPESRPVSGILEVLPDGEKGELVITTLGKEGMPMIRYRTRDICYLMRDKCACGRTTVRMSRVFGRTDDMLIIRGVNVFPSQVESVVLELPEFEPHYQLVVDRVNNLDTLQVQVEVREAFYSDEISQMMALKKRIADRLHSVLGIGADIRLMEPHSIERSEGKSKRVIDKRVLK